MELNHYETVFILNPVLSDEQAKEVVDKFKKVIQDGKGKIGNEENWGLKKLAYPIEHKSTGFYFLFEFEAPAPLVKVLETEYRRDERIMRFLVVSLDKHALAYNEKRKKGAFKKTKPEKREEKEVTA